MLIQILVFFRYVGQLFVEVMTAVSEKVLEWSKDPLIWIRSMGSIVIVAALMDGNMLFAVLVFLLTFSIERKQNL